jgi:hypothetical protein
MPPRRQKPASPRRVTAFLDTNAFLHFLPFDQIPWPKELKADSVALRVPREVIGELNKHKDGHRIGHMRERAGKILRRIMKFALANDGKVGSSGAITITCEQHAAGFDLEARGFNPTIADDRILAAVLDFKEQHPDEHVVLVTTDPGAALRAHSYGVLVCDLSDEMRIPPSPDEKEKRIRELEGRLNEMQKGLPRLGLSFPGGATKCELMIEPDTVVTEHDARTFADSEVSKLSPQQTGASLHEMAKNAQQTPLDNEVAASLAKTIGVAADIMASNARTKLVLFHRNCALYYSAAWKHTNAMRRTRELRLVVENTGTVPAEDIYLRLRLPKRVGIFPQGLSATPPAPPVPPGMPARPEPLPDPRTKARVQHAFEYAGAHELPEHWEVRFRLPQLNHHLTEQLLGLHIHFPSPAAVEPFEIEYRISARNAPDAVEGSLSVIPNPPPELKPRRIARPRRK